MDPLDRKIEEEIFQINQAVTNPISYLYECVIHTPNMDIPAFSVSQTELVRDYMKNFSDEYSINVTVVLDQAVFDILPFKSQLYITIKKTPLLKNQVVTKDTRLASEGTRYRCQLWDNTSIILEQQSLAIKNRAVARSVGMVSLKFQMITEVVEKLRVKTVGSSYRNIKPGDLIRYILGKYSRNEGDDASIQVKGVDIVPGINETVYEHIALGHNKALINAPRLIERYVGGLYPTGMGYYLQNGMWYVFSPYDIERFKKAPRTLTIINLTKDRYPNPEKTYRNTPSQLTFISTGGVKHVDMSDEQQLNQGNAVRFIDAASVMNGFVKTGGNKAVIDRTKNTRQYMVNPREEGENVVGNASSVVTSNYLLEMGKLARRSGSIAQFSWENSNDALVFPGMPVRVIYSTGETTREIYGIVISMETLTMNVSNNPVERQLRANSAVTVFLSNHILPSEYREPTAGDNNEQTPTTGG